MTVAGTLDVPCDGRLTFRRLTLHGLEALLLREERAQPVPTQRAANVREQAVRTFFRPVAYLLRPLGT